MKFTYVFFTCCLLFFGYEGHAQTNEIEKITEAFSFLTGQTYMLNKIKKDKPTLSASVEEVRDLFKATFGKAEKGIEGYMIKKLGEQGVRKMKDALVLRWGKDLVECSTEEAEDFLMEVEARAEGQIKSYILAVLLTFQYKDSPSEMYEDGFTTIFRTRGHAKAKNTDWQIRVPLSWSAKEAGGPDIIQKFSHYVILDEVYPSIMMMVKEFPNEGEGENIEQMVKGDFSGPGIRLIDYKRITIQGCNS